ncbi:adenylate/guanylate cyclase domain-containing protein [Variovorax humicola]|uniref:Adenylate/guanylate cyclase domain-containing protein n=1 Tax=Variovorax humicola TaxID=1769758 RepID=A0ABU8W3V2_9BURK
MLKPIEEISPFPELVRVRRAIVVLDVVESVRLTLQHEDDFIGRWRRFVVEVRDNIIPQHRGRMVKSLGDGMLMEFDTVLGAVNASLEAQQRIRVYNIGREPSAEIHLRIGVHDADVVMDDVDVYGAGVNLAARLATLAGADEVVISPEAHDALVPGFDADIEDLGDCYLKHFTEPQRAYRAGALGRHSASWSGSTAGSGDAVTIAIVPFVAKGDAVEGDAAFFGDALVDDVISKLSRSSQINVISRLSTAAFRTRVLDLDAIANALSCQYVVHGTCAISGDKVRVRALLVDCQSKMVLWADAIDGSVADTLAGGSVVVDRLTNEICKGLVHAEVHRCVTNPLPTLKSYTILMGAVAMMHRLSSRDFERSREMLVYLCERHPRATAPRAWLGKWHVMRFAQGLSPERTLDAQLARGVIAQALDLEPEHSLALAIDGLVCAYIKKDLVTAAQRYSAAIQANPNESLAWLFQSALHAYDEQGEQAVACAMRAQRLSPLDPLKYYYDNFTSTAMLSAGDFKGAIAFGKRSLRANCAHGATLRILAIAQVLDGQVDEARKTVSELLSVEPGFTASKFLDRYPGGAATQTNRYVDALRTAGLPA